MAKRETPPPILVCQRLLDFFLDVCLEIFSYHPAVSENAIWELLLYNKCIWFWDLKSNLYMCSQCIIMWNLLNFLHIIKKYIFAWFGKLKWSSLSCCSKWVPHLTLWMSEDVHGKNNIQVIKSQPYYRGRFAYILLLEPNISHWKKKTFQSHVHAIFTLTRSNLECPRQSIGFLLISIAVLTINPVTFYPLKILDFESTVLLVLISHRNQVFITDAKFCIDVYGTW